MKIKTSYFFLLTFVFCFLLCRFSHASTAQLKEANRQFWNGHYDEALKGYDDALIDTPNSSILHFNAGDAAYQAGKLDRAEKEFTETTKTAILPLRGAAHYNRGNTLFQQGKWSDAVEAYKDSLRTNPKDEDAKYNLSVALRVMKNPPKPKPQNGKGQPKESDSKQQKGQGDKKDQMSKEDAERLLAAVKANEPKKKNQQAAKPNVPHPDEDW